jgi:outer membrane protein assembly factor BamB
MGLLKKLFCYIAIFPLILIAGCSQSVIKTVSVLDKNPYDMFGRIPERSFYYPVVIGDSIKKIWDTSINGSFNNSSITYYDKYIFINDLSGRIYCFDMKTGKKVGQLKNSGAVYSTPLVQQFQVIYLCARNGESASELCYYDVNESHYTKQEKISGRAMVEHINTGDGIIFTTEKGIIYKYNLHGEKIWETDTKGVTYSSPSMSKNMVVFGNNEGEVIGLNASDGMLKYRIKAGGPIYGGTSMRGTNVYLGNDNGRLYCLDISSGIIKWQFRSGGRILMTPVFDDDNVYFGNLAGDFYSLNKLTGKLNWNKRLGSLFNVTPIVTQNLIILPDQFEKMYFVDKYSGSIRKTYSFEGRLKLTPVLKDSILFIGYDNGELEAYEIVK